MQKNSFISSTFWTDRVGFVAALETLNLMEKQKSWKQISKTGNNIKKKWSTIGSKNKLNLKISGLSSCLVSRFYQKIGLNIKL